MSEAAMFRQYAEEAMRWASEVKYRTRETDPDGACVHVDASGDGERARGV